MKGGSVASSAVESLVDAPTWEKLNVQFDNQVGGKKKKTSTKKQDKKKSSKQQEKKSTGNKEKHSKHQKGGMCPMCGGGMKHINDFESEGLFNLYNKKGGANPSFSIKYDYSDAMLKPQHGDVINRALNTDIVGVMASESPSTLGSMNKTVEFGNVFGAPKVPFVYTGGSKKEAKQALNSKKTQSNKDSKAKKSKKTPTTKK